MSLDAKKSELPGGRRNVIVIEKVITAENDETSPTSKHWLNANWYRFSWTEKPFAALCTADRSGRSALTKHIRNDNFREDQTDEKKVEHARMALAAV